MPSRIGFLLVDSMFKPIFADDVVRSALTKNQAAGTSFEKGLKLLGVAIEPFVGAGQTRKAFNFEGRRWRWMRIPCNCCAGAPQMLHAFLLGGQDGDITYAASVAAMYRLTPRESQTLEALLEGISVKEIASKLDINPSTVKTYVRSISGKMGVTTRAELMSKVLSLSCSESLHCPFQPALAAIALTGVRN